MNNSKYLSLIRFHQYTKNLFLFAALFFSGNFLNTSKIVSSFIGFICFCLIASSIYIINDIIDIEKDKIHPKKKFRPIAADLITKNRAIALASSLAIISFTISVFFNINLTLVISTYFILNVFYCFGLKKMAIIDVFIIASGFVLRVIAGGLVTEIEISHWLIIMSFLLALFIAFAKRRDDLIIEQDLGINVRNNISGYSLEFINTVSAILIAVLIVCYVMYVTSVEVVNRFNEKPIYISLVFVLLGLLRYLQISIVEKNSGSPSKLILKDRFLQISVLSWMLFFVVIIYIK